MKTTIFNSNDGDCESKKLFHRECRKHAPLTLEEESVLFTKARTGDPAALNRIVEANSKYVVSVVPRYLHHGLNAMDLVQEGLLGLNEAAKRFDEARGVPFLAYAKLWIKQYVLRAIDEKASMVRTPSGVKDELKQISHTIERLFQQLEREPTESEIAESLVVSEARIRDLRSSRISHENIFLFATDKKICLAELLAGDWNDRPDAQMMA